MTSCFHGEYIKKTFIIWPKLSILIHLQMGKLWNWTKGQKYYPFWRIQGWRANIILEILNVHLRIQPRKSGWLSIGSDSRCFKIWAHHFQASFAVVKMQKFSELSLQIKTIRFLENDPNYGRQRTLNLAVWRRFMEFVIRGHKILSNL